MSKIPRLYRAGSDVLMTQGVSEITSGRNMVNLYCGRSLSGASQALGEYRFNVANPMSNVPFRSQEITTYLGVSNQPRGLEFEIPFEKTQIIEGRTIVQMEWALTTSGAASGAVLMTLGKVGTDNTFTELVSGATRTMFASSGTTFSGASVVMDMPRTKFKRGEAFRLRLNIWEARSTQTVIIFHDPLNGSFSGAEHTDLIVQTPFDFPSV